MPNPNEVEGVFDVIDTEEHVAPQPKPTETKTETEKAESPKVATTTEADEAKTNTPKQTTDEVEGDNETGDDTQDFSRENPTDQDEATETEPSKTKTETNTETSEAKAQEEDIDWTAGLPTPPPLYQGKTPEINEEGQLTNMDALEYADYIANSTENRTVQRDYAKLVETRALEAAEKILPELKTNPQVRTLVENARTASIINGAQIDSYEAAKQVREALGLAPERLAQATQEAEAKGRADAKTSIEVQKRAALETTGSTEKPKEPSKASKLDKRLKSGDDSAFAELFEILDEEGKL